MFDAIELIKRKISASKIGDKPQSNIPSINIVFERLRGMIRLESGDTNSDYELIIQQDNVSLKSLKNQKNRINPEDLGFLVYGKNLVEGEKLLRELFKTCRT